MLASYVALDLAGRVAAAGGRARAGWLLGGSAAMGGGIWSMHFIAMLAFRLPVPIAFSVPVVLLAVAAAVAASALALSTVSRDRIGAARLAGAGLCMGGAITGMHYTGMAAMRLAADTHYSPALVAASAVIAVAASVAALWIASRLRDDRGRYALGRRAAAAVVMGAAIAGMHYTGMAAAHFTPRAGAAGIQPQHLVATSGLTGVVVAAALLILGIAVVGSLVDHAMRRRATDAASLARLAAIVESSSDAIDSKSLDGSVESWNAAAERLYGYTAAEIVGRPVTVLVPPERVAETTELLARIGRGERVDNFETVRLRRDGSPVHVSLTLSPIIDTAGRVTGVSSITRDISERKRADAALRESDERYELVARATNYVVWDWDLRTNAIYWNDAIRSVLGHAAADVSADAQWRLDQLHPDDLAGVSAGIRAVIDGGGEMWSGEYRFRRVDGSYAVMFDQGYVVRDARGRPVRMIGAMSDITSRKKAEEQLRESERQLADAQAMAHVGNWRYDLTTGAITWSDELYRIHGHAPGAIKPTYDSFLASVHPEDRARVDALVVAAVATGEPLDYEARAVWPDGSVRTIHARAAVARNEYGTPVAMVGIDADITERKRAEDALAASQAELQALVGAMTDVILVLDADGRYVKVAETATDLLYRPSPELLGRRLHEVLPPESADFFLAAVRRALNESCAVAIEYSLPFGDRTVWFAAVVSPMSGREVVLVARDITERKRVEAAERAAREAAEAATRAKSEFLANMSHEIRTPMNGVLGMLDLVLDTPLSGEQREYVEVAKQSADSLLAVINDVLDFSKVEAGRLELALAPFDVRDSLADAVRALAVEADGKGLELALHVLPDVPAWLTGDAGRLRQVLVNLVGNAIKFTHRGEVVITVETVPRDGALAARGGVAEEDGVTLHVAVRDTGVGIAAEKQQLIFGAFQQADSSTTREFGGTGLGLAIASQLVALMGGRVWVESELGAGSTFHFTTRLERGRGGAATPAAVPALPAATLCGVRVLVVDDNATNRRILEQTLAGWEMRPTAVDGGPAALAALRAARQAGAEFDLVLLDANMPGMDGFALAERIQGCPEVGGATVMMLSSAGQQRESARCRELGIAAYLTKPVKSSDLRRSIAAVLGATAPVAPARTAGPSGIGASGRPLRLLLVDDNAVNRRLGAALLERRGHSVAVAENGELALAALAREAFDLVLMDVHMPVMGGFEATAAIRAQERATRVHLPVVAMTARAMAGDREQCLEAGMDDYVAKPIQAAELFAVVERLTARR